MNFFFQPMYGLPKLDLQVKHADEYACSRTYDTRNKYKLIILDSSNMVDSSGNNTDTSGFTFQNIKYELEQKGKIENILHLKILEDDSNKVTELTEKNKNTILSSS